MNYRTLALLPVAAGLALAAVALAAGDRQGDVLAIENEASKLLGLAGCLAAALAFERGDYLRRAWMLVGSCYVLLLVSDALGVAAPGHSMVLVQGALALAANACTVAGTWMLAHAFRAAGLTHDDEAEGGGRGVLMGAVVVSLAVTGWPLMHDVADLLAGRFGSLVSIASDLGDAVTLALVAPVLRTALAMRGGVLRWPWGFLTVSGVGWIVYDGVSDVVVATHVGPGLLLVATESLRTIANGYVFSSGLAQRMTVSTEPPSLTAA